MPIFHFSLFTLKGFRGESPDYLEDMERVEKVLGEEGVIARHLLHYEYRPQQMEMARAVEKAIRDRAQLMVEAGTGVGKSLAYLIPFILWAVENDKRVVVSTNTKTLQQQLVDKDLPFLRDALGWDFRFALCLGGENYLCLRRYHRAKEGLLLTKEEVKVWAKLTRWVSATKEGLKGELDFEVNPRLWDEVSRQRELCLGGKCPFRRDCYYGRARRNWEKAHILVVNHHLYFANLACEGALLPPIDGVVFDEAQVLEEVASHYLGGEVSNHRIAYLLNEIHNPRTGKGVISRLEETEKIERIEEAVAEVRRASALFFENLMGIIRPEEETITRRIRKKNLVANVLREPLNGLISCLEEVKRSIKDEERKIELEAYLSRAKEINLYLEIILKQEREDTVYWVEISKKRRGIRSTLAFAPIDVAQELKERVFAKVRPLILTSATLSSNRSFTFLKERLGIENARELILNSPFDYEKQVLLYLPSSIPDPDYQKPEAFEEGALKETVEIITRTKGRAFVLFTSFRLLDRFYERLVTLLPGMSFFKQGDKPRHRLLEDFKRSKNGVLLGTDTFWQGIDVPGRALECVIITKLPFKVPDDPLTEARIEALRIRGKNPFIHYQVPQATIMFRQGFGRLIRTKKDYGLIAILDLRVKTRGYGKIFLNSLPQCRQTSSLSQIEEFFRHIPRTKRVEID